jgi:hypothetical protein
MTGLNVSLARARDLKPSTGRTSAAICATNTIAMEGPNPHRPFTAAEVKRREELAAFLDRASEDVLIEEVLMPPVDDTIIERSNQ